MKYIMKYIIEWQGEYWTDSYGWSPEKTEAYRYDSHEAAEAACPCWQARIIKDKD
ncbi:hypothetical protein M0R36_10945 [bacterium]|jgi:hypothetical protein|nr:hypothetical protein [bacterium]